MCVHVFTHVQVYIHAEVRGNLRYWSKYLTFLNGGFLKALIDHRKVIILLNPKAFIKCNNG